MNNNRIHMTILTLLAATFLMGSCEDADLGSAGTGAVPTDGYTINTGQMVVRDPWVYTDTEQGLYYLHTRSSVGGVLKVKYYVSQDLQRWKHCGDSYVPGADFWGKLDCWAPDMTYYNGKYYMFVTFSTKADGSDRGTSIFSADTPGGPFTPLGNGPLTPPTWMCLDATLYVDADAQPWMVFCRSWRSIVDGEIYVQKLSADLSTAEGTPTKLFSASQAPWCKPITSEGKTGYITDAPCIHTNADGSLVMLWSSFNKNGEYVIGQARSASGNPTGPWELSQYPLNKDRGGHAMLFNDLAGKLKISYHSPNSGPERITIKDVHITSGGWVEFDNPGDRFDPNAVAPDTERMNLYATTPTDGGNGIDPSQTTDGGSLLSKNTKAELIVYRPAKNKATGYAIIACPGGSYTDLFYGSFELFAKKAIDKGVAFITLNYRVPNGRPQIPLNDLTAAIDLCMAKATEWNIDPVKIGILGVSAGGHLASYATVTAGYREKLDFGILIYPVITMQDAGTHTLSRTNFLGASPSIALKDQYSNELHVTTTTPRTYVAYGLQDAVVNIDANSRSFVTALQTAGVPYVADVYPDKAHAMLEYPETLYSSILTWVLDE